MVVSFIILHVFVPEKNGQVSVSLILGQLNERLCDIADDGCGVSLNRRRIAKVSGERSGPIFGSSLVECALFSLEDKSETILHLVLPCFYFFTA